MLLHINRFLQKYIAVLTLLSLFTGIWLSDYGHHFLFIVPFLFSFMTFAGSLRMKSSDMKIFVKAPGTILLIMAMLHIIMPFISYLIASMLFNDPLLIIGFVMLMSVPTGVTSVIWVNVGKGDMPLCLAVIMLDTMLSPFIIPGVLHIVSRTSVKINASELIIDLILMIVVPTIAAIIINETTHGKVPDKIGTKLSPLSKLSLFAIIFINGSAIAPYIDGITWPLMKIILTVFVVVILGYAVSLMLSHYIAKSHARKVSITFLVGMRNISTGVIVATTYFPPKTAMPVAFGMLFQQALASIFSKILMRHESK